MKQFIRNFNKQKAVDYQLTDLEGGYDESGDDAEKRITIYRINGK